MKLIEKKPLGGIYAKPYLPWIPAFAGMTGGGGDFIL